MKNSPNHSTDLCNLLRSNLRKAKKALATSFRKQFRMSDVHRWSRLSSLDPEWDPRTVKLAEWIKPGESVLEFGAGRRVLEKILPEGCTYTPSDIVDRGEGTIVCDLNNDALPTFPKHDVAVLSGVLEYVNDIPRLFLWLRNSCDTIIFSYAVSDDYLKTAAVTSRRLLSRRANGWVNDFTAKQIEEIIVVCGFKCENIAMCMKQRIYKVARMEMDRG